MTWPSFRYDLRNSGRSPLPGVYRGDAPWFFQTGKGIFSTPVIDGSGVIYVGSADHYFYALNPQGDLRWKFLTGEVIDSAAALGCSLTGEPAVTFLSGDGRMYHCRRGDVDETERLVWTFEAELRPGVSFNRWFEGNVAIGPDGTLYAGNTNFQYYAVNPDGTLKWKYAAGSNCWSQAAFGEDGAIFWGALDGCIRSVSPQGRELWKRRTLGFVAASATLGSDGAVYIGSFDSNLYALLPRTGKVRWKFGAGEHIYSSAALGQDDAGQTDAIYFGSADGYFYALRPDGSLKWKFWAGDPIRSSPAIGLDPGGQQEIVYFGCGDGRLYALHACDGSLRWAYDTTPAEVELGDRNDLNSSPALASGGVVISGEHGQVWYIPYDYPLHHEEDRRGLRRAPARPAGRSLFFVTPGGSTLDEFPAELPASAMLTLRLASQLNGQSQDARLYNGPLGRPRRALQVRVQPEMPLAVEPSADGRYIYIRPGEFWQPGQVYTLQASGWSYGGGYRLGNLSLGGRRVGEFDERFTFQVQAPDGPLPLALDGERTAALEWTRLAAPLPSMLPSLNQIGFDYIDWLIGVARIEPEPGNPRRGRCLLWAVGAKRNECGELLADPESPFALPLNGRYQDDAFILENRAFSLPITGIHIPFNLFELRGRLRGDRVTLHPAAFADTAALAIPNFGPYLVLAGLANNVYQKLLVAGTYVTRPYDGPANRRPLGISLDGLQYRPPKRGQDGRMLAAFRLEPGATYPAAMHRASLVLLDAQALQAVPLDYAANLHSQADAAGNLRSVELSIPRRAKLPANLAAVVLLDVYPLHRQDFSSTDTH
jgi:outer membrane protein assembly factor BamB